MTHHLSFPPPHLSCSPPRLSRPPPQHPPPPPPIRITRFRRFKSEVIRGDSMSRETPDPTDPPLLPLTPSPPLESHSRCSMSGSTRTPHPLYPTPQVPTPPTPSDQPPPPPLLQVLDEWVNEARRFGPEGLRLTLCANQTGAQRHVSEVEAREWAVANGASYFEAPPIDGATDGGGHDVKDMFENIFRMAYEKRYACDS